MTTLGQDLRSALRTLRRSPGFTATAFLSLTLGLGIAGLTFGIARAVELRPLPCPEPQRLVTVRMSPAGDTLALGLVSYADFLELRGVPSFAAAGAQMNGFSLTLQGPGPPRRVGVAAVSAGLFETLGVRPLLGRTFRGDEDRPGGPPVLLLSQELWQSLGSDPGLIGRPILADEKPYVVIGVLPAEADLQERHEAWVPLASRADPRGPRSLRRLFVVARLRPGASLAQAGRELASAASAVAGAARHTPAEAVPLRAALLGSDAAVLRAMAGAAGFILLIACANLVHLLLARAVERRRELAVRAAFGAGRSRLAGPIVAESVLLSLAGGAAGTALAALALWRLDAVMPALKTPPWMRFAPDGAFAGFAVAAMAVTALLLAAPTAFFESRPRLVPALAPGGGSAPGRRRHRLGGSLVAAEVAVATVLLTGATLFGRSFLTLRGLDSGLRPDHLLTLWTSLAGDRYADAGERSRRVAEIVGRLAAIPGVEAAAGSSDVPLYISVNEDTIEAEGRPAPAGGGPGAFYTGVTSDYFRTLGATLTAGRSFTAGEIAAGAPVAVINQALAARLGPAGAPGRRLRLASNPGLGWLTVLGVAADVRYSLDSGPAPPRVYVPFRDHPRRFVGLLVRTRGGPDAPAAMAEMAEMAEITAEAARQVSAADPRLPVFWPLTMDQVRDERLSGQRLWAEGLVLYGAVALVLAVLGVYGVLSYAVSRRRREMGIRLALGARRTDVLRLIVGRGLLLALAGLALGLPCALLAGHFMAPLLDGVSPTDPVSYAGVSLLLLDISFIASWLPARRALEVDPVTVLRQD